MLPYLRGNYTPQRVVTASVFSAFVNHCKDDRELLQKLVNSLLSSIVDPNVKLLTLKGLSNVVANGPEQTNRYAPTIIDALVSSIDDQDEVIAMESMLGLSKVFGIVDESRVAPILVNICHRIRPAFEKVPHTIEWGYADNIAAQWPNSSSVVHLVRISVAIWTGQCCWCLLRTTPLQSPFTHPACQRRCYRSAKRAGPPPFFFSLLTCTHLGMQNSFAPAWTIVQKRRGQCILCSQAVWCGEIPQLWRLFERAF